MERLEGGFWRMGISKPTIKTNQNMGANSNYFVFGGIQQRNTVVDNFATRWAVCSSEDALLGEIDSAHVKRAARNSKKILSSNQKSEKLLRFLPSSKDILHTHHACVVERWECVILFTSFVS